jgi:hypothetical protein
MSIVLLLVLEEPKPRTEVIAAKACRAVVLAKAEERKEKTRSK